MSKYIILGVVLLGWLLTAPASAQYPWSHGEGWGVEESGDPADPDQPNADEHSAACEKGGTTTEELSESEEEASEPFRTASYFVGDDEWTCEYDSEDEFNSWHVRDADWFTYRVYYRDY